MATGTATSSAVGSVLTVLVESGLSASVVYVPTGTASEETMPTGRTDSSQAAADNPLLAFQPAYTYSMPTQVLIHGIVITLLSVLTAHLVFTARYHYPLSKLNFILLLASVLVTLAYVVADIVIVNKVLLARSRYWPFMFDYVEVEMPPDSWNTAQMVGWALMQASVTLLTHATHIQFLTLLFPSSLERKLIFIFLGPLAIISSILYFTSFFTDSDFQDLGDAIRNTANSTLTLLYTAGLIIWGAAINRKRAWDQEGGTAGFGILAISLAVIGTATNFVEVSEERLHWLPWVVWTVLLWQSWTGFWWWVGAGMWSGEVEDIAQREEKRRRREEKRLRKRERRLNQLVNETEEQAAAANANAASANGASSATTRLGAALSSGAGTLSRRIRRGLGVREVPRMELPPEAGTSNSTT